MKDGLGSGSDEDATPDRRIDWLCDVFESEWEVGRRTRIEDALAELPESDRPAAFEELLRLELSLRRGDDECPEPREYHDRFPEYAGTIGAAFGLTDGELTSSGRRFQILRFHAEGGHGRVSVARDEELNREVALKEIKPKYADNPASRSRFLIEAEITGRLEHPGIVPVYGLGHYDDGRPFYAMRFIEGDSLEDAIDAFHDGETLKAAPGARTLELQKLLRRFLDVCNAVAYAHSRGVLHRDLKPGNVMLGSFGETLVVDWGLAKSVDHPEGQWAEFPLSPFTASTSAGTIPGSANGTLAYMSPEQASGEVDRQGPASDIYSLGATLYSLLTGKAPFEGKDRGELLDRVKRGDYPRPRTGRPALPRPLEAICMKAMALDPGNRYATAKAMAEDIEHWLADEPVSAYREGWRLRLSRWGKRHRTWLQAAAMLLLLTTIVSVAAVVLIDQSLKRAREAETKAIESEGKAREAERIAHEAETKAIESEGKAREAERIAHEAGQRILDNVREINEAKTVRDFLVALRRRDPHTYRDFVYGQIRSLYPPEKSKPIESDQTHENYLATRGHPLDPRLTTIYIQQVGDLDPIQKQTLGEIVTFLKPFFGRTVVTLAPPLRIDSIPPSRRRRIVTAGQPREQLDSTALLDLSRLSRRPDGLDDAAVVLSVTGSDLWNSDNKYKNLNYILGLIGNDRNDRRAVISLAKLGDGIREDDADRRFRRAAKLSVWAVAQALGVRDYLPYDCIANRVNGVSGLDNTRLELCPECLYKVWWELGSDPLQRYEALVEFAQRRGLKPEEAFWRSALTASRGRTP